MDYGTDLSEDGREFQARAAATDSQKMLGRRVLTGGSTGRLGGAAVPRRTRDRKVASSTPGRDAIKSTRSTQPSIPPGNRVPACMAGVRRGAFTCVGWQVTLCDPIWQVTSRSSETGFP